MSMPIDPGVQNQSATQNGFWMNKGVMIVVALCLLLFLLIVLRGKKRSSVGMVLFFVVAGVGVMGVSEEASADTFVFSPDQNPYTVTVNHNKLTYTPGETVNLTSSISSQVCYNGWNSITGTLKITSPVNKQIDYWDKNDFQYGSSPNCSLDGYFQGHAHYSCNTGFIANNFSVQSTPGSYNASYSLSMTYFKYGTKTATGNFNIPYTVVAPPTCGTANGATLACGNFASCLGGRTVCSSGGATGYPGTEPGGANPLALHNPTSSSTWVGWDWTCSGSAPVSYTHLTLPTNREV